MQKLLVLSFVAIISVFFFQTLSLDIVNAETKTAATQSIIRRSEGVLRGSALNRTAPEYPRAAKEQNVEGDVIVQITIDEEGKVSNARAMSGHELLVDAAVEAAKQWTFKPTKLNDHDVKVSGILTFRFKLGSLAATTTSLGESQTDENIIKRSEGVIRGLATNRVSPEYPRAAKEQNVEGDVTVQIIINEEGKVVSAKATSGHELLQDVSVTAAKGWTFKPFELEGKPTRVSANLSFRFKLGSFEEDLASEGIPLPSIIRRSEGVLRNNAINKALPQYPALAKTAEVEGDVVVEITVDEEGSVTVARVISGHPLLQASSIAAAKQWTFNPTSIDGNPVKVSGVLTFRFALDKNK
ncbi:MAG: energy transducer TonB [Blastocatellia bacterium]